MALDTKLPVQWGGKKSVTEDDLDLPMGYHTDARRRCEFFNESHSSGPKGLALAVLLRAVEDGCNREWIEELARFYDLELPRGMLSRAPTTRIGAGNRRLAEHRLVLSLFDAITIPRRMFALAG